MSKTGRNFPCPCGSGKKHKKCCLDKDPTIQTAQPPAHDPRRFPLTSAVKRIQQSALAKEQAINIIGVFVIFSTSSGDAWLVEISEMDGLQVAHAGQDLKINIEENPQTIEINYSHRIRLEDSIFTAVPYKDGPKEAYPDYPNHAIAAALKKARKKFPAALLNEVHLKEEQQ